MSIGTLRRYYEEDRSTPTTIADVGVEEPATPQTKEIKEEKKPQRKQRGE